MLPLPTPQTNYSWRHSNFEQILSNVSRPIESKLCITITKRKFNFSTSPFEGTHKLAKPLKNDTIQTETGAQRIY